MTTTIKTATGNTTITIAFTTPTEKRTILLESLTDALFAERDNWEEGGTLPKVYAELTQAQKLKMVDAFVRRAILDRHAQRTSQMRALANVEADRLAGEAAKVTLT